MLIYHRLLQLWVILSQIAEIDANLSKLAAIDANLSQIAANAANVSQIVAKRMLIYHRLLQLWLIQSHTAAIDGDLPQIATTVVTSITHCCN